MLQVILKRTVNKHKLLHDIRLTMRAGYAVRTKWSSKIVDGMYIKKKFVDVHFTIWRTDIHSRYIHKTNERSTNFISLRGQLAGVVWGTAKITKGRCPHFAVAVVSLCYMFKPNAVTRTQSGHLQRIMSRYWVRTTKNEGMSTVPGDYIREPSSTFYIYNVERMPNFYELLDINASRTSMSLRRWTNIIKSISKIKKHTVVNNGVFFLILKLIFLFQHAIKNSVPF